MTNAIFGRPGAAFDPVAAEWSRRDAGGAVRRALAREDQAMASPVGYRGGPLPFGPARLPRPVAPPRGGRTAAARIALAAAALLLGAVPAAELLDAAPSSPAIRAPGEIGPRTGVPAAMRWRG
jgi:hypothetical protein